MAYLFLPSSFDTFRDVNADLMPGSKLAFYNEGTTVAASTYTDATGNTEHAWPVVADVNGVFPAIYLDEDHAYRAKLFTAAQSLSDTAIRDRDNIKLSLPSTVVHDTDLSADGGAALIGTASGDNVQEVLDDLTALGTEGLFTAIGSRGIPANVGMIRVSGYRAVGDGGQGVYLKWAAPLDALPAPGAGENEWWAESADGAKWYPDPRNLWFEHFGAYGDYVRTGYFTGTVGHDDLAAFKAFHNSYSMWAGINPTGVEPTSWYAVPKLHFGIKNYYFSDNLDIYNGIYDWEGGNLGNPDGGNATTFMMAAGKGVFVNHYNTTLYTTRTAARGASYSEFKNILLHSLGAGSGLTCGWRLRTACRLVDCGAENFELDGVNCVVTIGGGGALEGNANLTDVIGGIYRWNGRAGIYWGGADTNVSVIGGKRTNCYSNARFGVMSTGGLGIMVNTVHTDGNGTLGGSAGPSYARQTVPSRCVYGGGGVGNYNLYVCVVGQETAASTTAPGTNDAVWFPYIRLGQSATTDHPLWVTGQTWISSGAFHSIGGTDVFIACYSEANQPPSQFGNLYCKVYGGNHSAGRMGGDNDGALGGNGFGSTRQLDGLKTEFPDASGNNVRVLLGNGCEGRGNFMEFGHAAIGAGTFMSLLRSSGLLVFRDSSSNFSLGIVLDGSTITGGRTTPPVGAVAIQQLLLGDFTADGGRVFDVGTAAPSTGYHRDGEIVFRTNPTAGGKVGWVCTTAGTPGTWKPFGAIDA